MKYDHKIHVTERWICSATNLSPDAVRVRMKLDPKAPVKLSAHTGTKYGTQPIHDKQAALEWINWLATIPTYKGQPAEPRKPVPLGSMPDYKPSALLSINMQRASDVYPHDLMTPKGVGNFHHNHDYGM